MVMHECLSQSTCRLSLSLVIFVRESINQLQSLSLDFRTRSSEGRGAAWNLGTTVSFLFPALIKMAEQKAQKLPGVPETLLKKRKSLEKIRAARAKAQVKHKKVICGLFIPLLLQNKTNHNT